MWYPKIINMTAVSNNSATTATITLKRNVSPIGRCSVIVYSP